MNTQLKRAIIHFIFDNAKVYQLHNITTKEFRNYIYDPSGEYLIGGKDVENFIEKAIKLLID